MDQKPNIIYLSGEDSYGIDIEKRRLKEAFLLKYGDTNIDVVRIEEVHDWRGLEQDMLTTGLFVEKRLFLISGGWQTKKTDETKETKKEKKGALAETALISICENLPSDHFIIFSDLIFGPKSEFMKWITSHATIKSYNKVWEVATWGKRFPELNDVQIRKILGKYEKISLSEESVTGNISHMIGHTLTKLSFLDKTDEESESLSIEMVGGGKMFDLSDAILRGDMSGSLRVFRTLIESTNIYALIGSLIGLLRPAVYIKYWKEEGKNLREIGTLVTAHPFVVQKAYESKISYQKIRDFYTKLIDANIAYKSGKGLYDPELGRIFAIERALMGLKK